MEIKQGKTANGSLTNCVFVKGHGNAYCYSYEWLVAALVDGQYEEYKTPSDFATENNGKDMFNSHTTRKHKRMFLEYLREEGLI